MFKWIKDIKTALGIVSAIRPVIDLFVKTSETPGHGPEKKAAVLKGIKDTLTELRVPEPIQKIVLAIASGIIEVIVLVLNITGMFRHQEDEE